MLNPVSRGLTPTGSRCDDAAMSNEVRKLYTSKVSADERYASISHYVLGLGAGLSALLVVFKRLAWLQNAISASREMLGNRSGANSGAP